MLTDFSDDTIGALWKRRLIRIFLLVFLVMLVMIGKGDDYWPFVQWNLYAGVSHPGAHKAAKNELRVIDTAGATHTVELHSLLTLDDDVSTQPTAVGFLPLSLFEDGNLRRSGRYRDWLVGQLMQEFGIEAREIQLWRLTWDVDYSESPPIQLDQPRDVEMTGTFIALPYVDARRPPAAPDRDADLVFDEQLDLLAFDVPLGVAVAACESVYVRTWWQVRDELPQDYHITVVLTDSDGVGRAQHDDLLAGVNTTRLAAGVDLLDRTVIDVPCDLPPGDYNLLTALYILDQGNDTTINLPVAYPDGTPVGEYAYLTTLSITEAAETEVENAPST